ncbi:hypothetical protein [Stenotrophomonas aracearum]|uniref:Uncharacterized protein n=1 Tax=Stenotrophomonas aracearum TaxID=3003272 RepID=A0ABY9YFH0_9GAMM|nr:hypothetical protein [Stenotrophomonas sp. A5588]WNH49630.1 hypothetical protein PDM28_04750 [Stenotrophomonas sp. A5588]
MLHLPSGRGGEATHQQGCSIERVLNIGFPVSDVARPTLRHQSGKEATGDSKFYVGGH